MIHREEFPELSSLTLGATFALSQSIRGELRPRLLDRLAMLYAQSSPCATEKSEQGEIEARLDKIDVYAYNLDKRLFNESPVDPVQHRQPSFNILRLTVHQYIEADSAMFFSAESLTNVHGPVMLLHFAAVAMKIAHGKEFIVAVRKAAFKKLVTRQMRLFVFDRAQALSDATTRLAETASVSGNFLMSSGRNLEFFGIQIAGRAIVEFAHFNSCALSLMPKGLKSELDDGVYSMQLLTKATDESIPRGGFTPALTIMTMLDIWMLMFLALPLPYRTKLMLGFQELEALKNPLQEFSAGIIVQCRLNLEKARLLKSGLLLLRADFRFFPRETVWRRAHIALGVDPYYKVLTSGSQLT